MIAGFRRTVKGIGERGPFADAEAQFIANMLAGLLRQWAYHGEVLHRGRAAGEEPARLRKGALSGGV